MFSEVETQLVSELQRDRRADSHCNKRKILMGGAVGFGVAALFGGAALYFVAGAAKAVAVGVGAKAAASAGASATAVGTGASASAMGAGASAAATGTGVSTALTVGTAFSGTSSVVCEGAAFVYLSKEEREREMQPTPFNVAQAIEDVCNQFALDCNVNLRFTL